MKKPHRVLNMAVNHINVVIQALTSRTVELHEGRAAGGPRGVEGWRFSGGVTVAASSSAGCLIVGATLRMQQRGRYLDPVADYPHSRTKVLGAAQTAALMDNDGYDISELRGPDRYEGVPRASILVEPRIIPGDMHFVPADIWGHNALLYLWFVYLQLWVSGSPSMDGQMMMPANDKARDILTLVWGWDPCTFTTEVKDLESLVHWLGSAYECAKSGLLASEQKEWPAALGSIRSDHGRKRE